MPRKGSYVPKNLREMRKVWNQTAREDTGPSERRLREIAEKSPAQFLAMMNKMEVDLKERREELRKAKIATGESQTDAGSERIEELLKQILEAVKCTKALE